MRLITIVSFVLGVFLFVACHTSESAGAIVVSEGTSKQELPLWDVLSEEGVANFFANEFSEGRFGFDFSWEYREPCTDGALGSDYHTIYYEKLDVIYREGSLVDGLCGQALRLKDGEVAPLKAPMSDSLKVGTVEFLFRPGEDFYEKEARTLLGDNRERIHFFYMNGKLYFQMNTYSYVEGSVEFDEGWNHIAGQWGENYMSLWVNDKLVAKKWRTEGYAPEVPGDPFKNILLIGFNSGCCTGGIGPKESMTTSGDFDEVRISDVLRYRNYANSDPDTDDEDSEETDYVDTDSGDTIFVDLESD